MTMFHILHVLKACLSNFQLLCYLWCSACMKTTLPLLALGVCNPHLSRLRGGYDRDTPLSPLLYILYVANLRRKLSSCGLGFQLKYSTVGVDERCTLEHYTGLGQVRIVRSGPGWARAQARVGAVLGLGLIHVANGTCMLMFGFVGLWGLTS